MAINEDILLFNHVKQGNRGAFEKLFRMYYTPICRFIYRYVNDEDTSEEIAQDMFIYFWQNAPIIDIKTSLKAYLFTSARNFSLNYIRKISIRRKYHEIAQNEMMDAGKIMPEETITRFRELLYRAVKSLPDKCREIFELSKYEGLSYEEISDFLGLSRKTVENQMGIALSKIRKWIEPYKNEIYEQQENRME